MSSRDLPRLWPVATPDRELIGEVICWTCAGVTIRHADLTFALTEAELDAGVARELAPRHAFTRACRKLSDARIIRSVAEDAHTLTFQFTAEHRDGSQFAYELEAMLTLDKQTGHVTCPVAQLATLAQAELDRCLEARTGGDVTRVVQKLFERHADLFPVRPQGGAYFVPIQHAPFVDRVQRFLGRLDGQVLRFPVPAGTVQGDRAVTTAVAEGLNALVAEHAAAIEAFDVDTRPSTVERAAERIRTTRYKVEAYSTLLADQRERLERSLVEASSVLRAKLVAMSSEREAVASH